MSQQALIPGRLDEFARGIRSGDERAASGGEGTLVRSRSTPSRRTRRQLRVGQGDCPLRSTRARSAPRTGPGGWKADPISRVRYYDPTTGQFLTRDPAVASTRSAYGYTYGNPLNTTDPSGLDSYSYTYDLGTQGTPEQLAAWTIASCADVFPIQGCNSRFKVGDSMLLQQQVRDCRTGALPRA